jgi:2-succinyl-5-enolpyruvyl-6-hydroxy-3-cyclohexene-1-carboxylate synthase
MQALARSGVTDVVISPGSRSTPFVIQAVRRGLSCHPVVDERSAAFFALGQAKVTGRPTLLLCTSGSAAAHYLPAVIEAEHSYTPLLVLTADRPFELSRCAAPQTIDQTKLFGDHVRGFFELGMPDGTPGALRALMRVAAEAVLLSCWPEPGAVHLNARARKPLEPAPAHTEEEHAAAQTVRELSARRMRVFAPRSAPLEAGLNALARACLEARRGLIICGPAPLAQAAAADDVWALAADSGFPLLCEAPSQLRFTAVPPPPDVTVCDAFDALLRSPRFAGGAPPDLILQLGAPPTSPSWERYLAAHPDCRRWVMASHGWNDPQSNAEGLLFCDLPEGARALAERLAGARSRPARGPWQERFARATAVAWREIEALLEDGDNPRLHEADVCRLVVSSLAPGSLLAIGNSLPVREVDSFCPAAQLDVGVWSQRGASGIDGLVSGAAGAASTGRATTLLLGDVSFRHDLAGLAIAAQPSLVMVILHNGGGRIFEQLPLKGAATPEELSHFTTPLPRSLAPAAELFGHHFVSVATRDLLGRALDEAHARGGCSVIEAVVAPDDAARIYAALPPRLDAALQAAGLPEG